MNKPHVLVPLAVAMLSSTGLGQRVFPAPSVLVELKPTSYYVPMGQPIPVRFSLHNASDDRITLTVPGAEPAIPSPESGLPISHVFSGSGDSGVVVATDSGRRWDDPSGYRARGEAPILTIAAHSSVGITLDLRAHFPVLRGAGQYRITWHPYAGAFGEASVLINVGQLKRAEITTDEGMMVMRLFYSDAPRHVANFIELAESGFYNGRLFHRVAPGYFVQGGCSRGDGTGIRPDGKRISAEFNGHPMKKGTVAMALLDDDPDSGSCQFFVCNTRQKDWDGRYTVFGELVGEESFATLDRLMSTPTDEAGRPLRALEMKSVRIVDAPPGEFP
ncbi:MAG: peptidylprolyl isomerase [Planctomycetes bacterium]|nr:peptidylprolyl isomerase [Planctomycetota bacterium]